MSDIRLNKLVKKYNNTYIDSFKKWKMLIAILK